MKGKITLLVGGAVGYVLGTRAGRERYEQIKTQAQGVWNNPKVQEKATQAQEFAKEKAPVVKDKVSEKVSEKVSGESDPGNTYPTSAGIGEPPDDTTVNSAGTGYPSSSSTTGLS